MPMPVSPEATRTFHYEAPSWARTWDGSPVTLPTDAELLDDLKSISAAPIGSDLILFAAPEEPACAADSLRSRLTAAFGIAAALAALLYFFGHVIAAWAMGRF